MREKSLAKHAAGLLKVGLRPASDTRRGCTFRQTFLSHRYPNVGAVIFVWVLLVGCASKHVVMTVPPVVITPAEFWADQDLRARQMSRVGGKLSLHYENDQQSLSGKGRAVSDVAGQMRLELRDAFGRLHYEAVLSGKNFTALYPRQKVAYVDESAGGSYLGEVVGIQLSFAEVQELWVGMLPKTVVRGEFRNWQWSPVNEAYEGLLKDDKGNDVLVGVDATTKALKRVEYRLKNQTAHVSFSEFEEWDEKTKMSLARVIAIQLVQSKHQSIEVEWEDIKGLKELTGSFQISIPEGTRKIVMK